MEKDVFTIFVFIWQIIFRFIIKPIAMRIIGIVNWCADNIFLFVSLGLALFIYFERVGLYYEVPSSAFVDLTLLPVGAFGYYMPVIIWFMLGMLFVLLLYLYSQIKYILFELYNFVVKYISGFILLLAFIYLYIFKKDLSEFVLLEGIINWKDVVLLVITVLFIIGSACGLIYFKLHVSPNIARDIGDDLLTNNSTNYNLGNMSEQHDWKEPEAKVWIKLTTEKNGERVIDVIELVDRTFAIMERKVADFYGIPY